MRLPQPTPAAAQPLARSRTQRPRRASVVLWSTRRWASLPDMELPVMPPVAPMLAKPVAAIPSGEFYEPKWDGFRSIVFRDGDEVEIGSRKERPMTRYFPEVVEAVRRNFPPRAVIDGEIVVAGDGGGLDFWALQQRIHPAASRVALLAAATPASFIAFDLLALGDDDLTEEPFETRRAALERALANASAPVHVTPITRDEQVAHAWFDRFEGAGLDGVIAKRAGLTYQPDKRVMAKIKHVRTADCVVAGYRPHKAAADAGEGRRGALRLPGGRPLPAPAAVRALAPGSRPGLLRLHATRPADAVRRRRRPRRATHLMTKLRRAVPRRGWLPRTRAPNMEPWP